MLWVVTMATAAGELLTYAVSFSGGPRFKVLPEHPALAAAVARSAVDGVYDAIGDPAQVSRRIQAVAIDAVAAALARFDQGGDRVVHVRAFPARDNAKEIADGN